jgi:hypothetical protein
MKRGAKVYYLKPLCIEMGDELILLRVKTSQPQSTRSKTKSLANIVRWHSTAGRCRPW